MAHDKWHGAIESRLSGAHVHHKTSKPSLFRLNFFKFLKKLIDG
jgi:hypothetical protein